MKLVEILARDLVEWPRDLVLVQGAGGSVYEAGGGEFIGYYDMAEDWMLAEVTRPQWQAESDRMKAMEAPKDARTTPEMIAAWKAAQGKAMPIEQIPEPTYEQQLWDRVAVGAMIAHMNQPNAIGDVPVEEFIGWGSEIADAFMAERAKRIKGE